MTARGLSAFIDAIATGRRPQRFRADPQDVGLLRAAIELRAARPGDAAPTAAFTEGLFGHLFDQANNQDAQLRSVPARRARMALVAAAAAAALVSGTAVTTETVSHQSATRTAAQAPHGAVRIGTFQSADGQVLGQIAAYRGERSWVFMNVDVLNYDGTITCMLQVDDGSTVAFGTFTVHDGIGQFSKTIGSVDVSHLRGAKLVSAAGTPLADATFAT